MLILKVNVDSQSGRKKVHRGRQEDASSSNTVSFSITHQVVQYYWKRIYEKLKIYFESRMMI